MRKRQQCPEPKGPASAHAKLATREPPARTSIAIHVPKTLTGSSHRVGVGPPTGETGRAETTASTRLATTIDMDGGQNAASGIPLRQTTTGVIITRDVVSPRVEPAIWTRTAEGLKKRGKL